ncbi:MAG: hypothetical protein QW506_00540 [Thermoproteota archaeon]
MKWDDKAEADEEWPETYSSLAEKFISKVMQKKGILLNYRRDTLHVADEYIRDEFKNPSKDISQEVKDTLTETLAYISKVIVVNFGGKPVFHPERGHAIVRNVAGLGIVAFPTVWLNRVIRAEPPAMLEDYYDHVAWLVNRLKTKSFDIDENVFTGFIGLFGSLHHQLVGETLLNNTYPGGTMMTLALCPSCNDIRRIVFSLPYEELVSPGRTILNIQMLALEPTRQPCQKCGGWHLPMGYAYSAVMTKEKLDKSFMKELFAPLFSESEERLLTLIVSSLGEGFILSSLLKRSSNAQVEIEKPEKSPLVEPGELFIFPSTPFCV